MSTVIDLSRLPAPDVLVPLDYETVLAEMKAAVVLAAPSLADVIELESEPAVKVLEIAAYYAVLKTAEINDGARAVLLPYATGADLDNLAALFGVTRLTLVEANPNASPPVAEVMESDVDLRRRVQLSLEGLSVTGPRTAYKFQALSADARVRDVAVSSPTPGEVLVAFYAEDEAGDPTSAPSSVIEAALNAEDVRPLCDTVTVAAATPLAFNITANLLIPAGPDPAVVQAEAEAKLDAFLTDAKKIGVPVPRSAIFAALHVPGVQEVELTAPAADIDPTASQIALAETITITREILT